MKEAVITPSSSDRVVIDDNDRSAEAFFANTGIVVVAAAFVLIAAIQLSLLLFAKNGALSFQAIASNAVLLASGLVWGLGGVLRLRSRPIVTLDAQGISGVAIAPKLNRLPWSRLRSYEIDGGAVVLDFEPADLLSDKPADRISKARVSLNRVGPEEIAAAIEKFWMGEEGVSGA